MAIPLESIPSFTPAQAQDHAHRLYGISGEIAPLPSERDQNFLISAAPGRKFVLKIANLNDAAQLLDFQNQAMQRVARDVPQCRVPRVVSSLQGLGIVSVVNARTGAEHWLRVLTWIDGQVLAQSATRDSALLYSIGAGMARLDAALRDFQHAAMRRILQWDLQRAPMARDTIGLLAAARRTQLERLFAQWQEIDWAGLRHSVIHGDANDHNILVEDGRMVGLLDFGDMVYSATVCDLAIALAYVMLGEREPLAAAAKVIQAYHWHYPLSDAEQRALYPLLASRLAMSVCYSAHNRARNPGDPYQVVSEASAWQLLDRLESCSPQHALASIRAACDAADGTIQ